ncbi:MAG: universal stress protein [Deltaproteobacteria bacterium]|jgi:nucleotide-binding universal stress UspA family protein|nr:universal stress protein [Deltaproteobacteria bacterium]
MKFLVGYDSSNSAKEALKMVAQYAKPFDAMVEVIASIEGGSANEEVEVQQARQNLEYAEAQLKEKGIAVKTHLLVRGMSPGEDIVDFAENNTVNAIFIGIKRRSKVGKLLFGSNAQYIILNAPCPVMTVK